MAGSRLKPLTVKEIEKLVAVPPPCIKHRYLGGVPGFTLVHTPAGYTGYGLIYRVSGKRKKLTLGSTKRLTLGDARKPAGRFRSEIEAGGDPHGERMQQREEATKLRVWRQSVRNVPRAPIRPAQSFPCRPLCIHGVYTDRSHLARRPAPYLKNGDFSRALWWWAQSQANPSRFGVPCSTGKIQGILRCDVQFAQMQCLEVTESQWDQRANSLNKEQRILSKLRRDQIDFAV